MPLSIVIYITMETASFYQLFDCFYCFLMLLYFAFQYIFYSLLLFTPLCILWKVKTKYYLNLSNIPCFSSCSSFWSGYPFHKKESCFYLYLHTDNFCFPLKTTYNMFLTTCIQDPALVTS